MASPANTATGLHDMHARARIHDAIVGYARSVDRCDRALIVSAFARADGPPIPGSSPQ